MRRAVDRRELLRSVGIGALAGIAGCSSALLTESSLSVPDSTRVGDPFPISVSGVDSDATVVVRADDRYGETFQREYDIGADTTVANPNMLFGGLKAVGSEDGSIFRAPKDGGIDVTVLLRRSGEQLDSVTTRREYIGPEIVQQRITQGERYYGSFYRPSDDAQGPGVLTLHGSGGAPKHWLSKVLASRGYPTLALNQRGLNGHPRAFTPVQYLTGAVDWLQDQPAVSGDRIGVIGHSLGGGAAMATGVHSPHVGAVITYDAATTSTGYLVDGETMAPYLVDGEPYRSLEELREFWEAMLEEINDRGGVQDCDLECYKQSYAALDADAQAKNTFRVEEIDGPVLQITSGMSPHVAFWVGPEEIAQQFSSNEWGWQRLAVTATVRLRQFDHPYKFDILPFGDAEHTIGFAPPYTLRATVRGDELAAEWGSDLRPATHRARVRAWPTVLDYLATGIGRP
jgi:pimeloyl-ACP methyl ester carboxylesterase